MTGLILCSLYYLSPLSVLALYEYLGKEHTEKDPYFQVQLILNTKILKEIRDKLREIKTVIPRLGVPFKPVDVKLVDGFCQEFVKIPTFIPIPKETYKLYAADQVIEKLYIATLHKGDAIRILLNPSLITQVYQERLSPDDVIIYIDGDILIPTKEHLFLYIKEKNGEEKIVGGFPIKFEGPNKDALSNLVNMTKLMLENKDLDAILALRWSGIDENGWRGIGWEEVLAELFEQWLITKIFGLREILLDGQCGFWSVRFGTWRACNIIASRYEIELNLLIELLKNNARIKFQPIVIFRQYGKREFHKYASRYREKLMFLCSYFRISPRLLEQEYSSFKEWILDNSRLDLLKLIDCQFNKLSLEKIKRFLNKGYRQLVLNEVIKEMEIKNIQMKSPLYINEELPLFRIRADLVDLSPFKNLIEDKISREKLEEMLRVHS